jgi:hypothetical protein
MTSYQIVYWRGIPAQIRLRDGERRLSQPLPDRFQKAIDQAAMRAGATDTDAYLEDWRTSAWDTRPLELGQLAQTLLNELVAEYPPARLASLVERLGFDEKGPD